MGSSFRSEDMSFCDMYLHADDAYECINRLGELGICQFKDMNINVNVFQRQFVNEIRKLDDLERIIRYFEGELQREGMVPFQETSDNQIMEQSLNDMIQQLEKMEQSVREMFGNVEQLEKSQNELIELSTILSKTREYFESITPEDLSKEGSDDEQSSRAALRYTVGVMPTARIYGFTRLLYFATRGASYCRHSPFEGQMKDPVTGNMVDKSTFMVLCSAQQLHNKINKIAESFQATLYPCPETEEGRMRAIDGAQQRLRDLELILAKSRESREESLREIARNLTSWKVRVIRMKACFHTLNLFRYEKNSLVGQCYLPTAYLSKVRALLNVSKDRASNIITPTYSKDLPTYHATNKFTAAFQNIIDAYGIASYKEINPAIFSIITFPFLFSVMFGDAGHGFLMLLFGIYLVLNERKLKDAADKSEILNIVFSGRYMILLMSIFSIYSGFMYNDVFSRPIALRSSTWKIIYDNNYLEHHPSSMLDPSNPNVTSGVYPFGLDPVWKLAENQITFTNSYKKKLSVIFGVAQMTLGVIIGLFNHVYFKKYVNIICEFIPMLVFLMSLFGYLSALIFAKWVRIPTGSSYYDCSPNLLIDFINMFMMKYEMKDDPKACPTTWFDGQKPLQMALVVLAVFCALWLLLSKPIYLLIKDKARRKKAGLHQHLVEDEDGLVNSTNQLPTNDQGRTSNQERGDLTSSLALHNDQVLLGSMVHSVDLEANISSSTDDHDNEPFEFGEVMIHQAIHTIEFCLGCISHTASYLRLWALSLAHAQLSEVLWVMVLRTALKQTALWKGALFLFVIFAPFAVLSVVILILMEGLSAFLHTLRLHWVEFNSKFYQGEGHAFEPFSFEHILKQSMD